MQIENAQESLALLRKDIARGLGCEIGKFDITKRNRGAYLTHARENGGVIGSWPLLNIYLEQIGDFTNTKSWWEGCETTLHNINNALSRDDTLHLHREDFVSTSFCLDYAVMILDDAVSMRRKEDERLLGFSTISEIAPSARTKSRLMMITLLSPRNVRRLGTRSPLRSLPCELTRLLAEMLY